MNFGFGMSSERLRCTSDKQLYDQLLQHRDVIRANEYIKREEEKGPLGTRRRLLATSVRLSREMAPDLHAMADDCIAKLGMTIPLELYVYSSPHFNAMCYKPEEGRLFIMFSSSLLQGFNEAELRFVMGHELGHHVYRHHDIPIGLILKGGKPGPRLALSLFAWSRYAEISADRAGAHCSGDFPSMAKALFKLASGLTDDSIKFHLEAFISQVDEMQTADAEPGQGAAQEDWFSTHPFSPLRVKALQMFDRSELANADGFDKDELELQVQGLMSLMEPSYLEGKTDSAIKMRRLLYAAAICVADASEGISDAEIKVFEEFFGKGEYSNRDLDLKRIKETLDERINNVREVATPPQCMQVIRDLCVMAKANGGIHQAEREVIESIADGLAVPRGYICQALELDCTPD